MTYKMESHSYYNDLLEELFNDCKIQYGNAYSHSVDKNIDIKYFIKEYVLQNNYKANKLIKELSVSNNETEEDLREGLINMLEDELRKYLNETLKNEMDISGGRGGSGRYKKSSKTKTKTKKNI
jgi:hypothetical protein